MRKRAHDFRTAIQWLGLTSGPVLAFVAYCLLPVEYRNAGGQVVPFTTAGRITLALMAWMAVWWITEAVDISVTALVPLVVLPTSGAATMEAAAAPYANPLIYLFLGGFVISIAMQRWGLDRRVALLTLRVAGTRPPRMVAGFMVTTAGISAFVSNTATAAMMVPIALSVVTLVRGNVREGDEGEQRRATHLSTCMLLGVAYAASIGGLATLVGSPPNALVAAFVEKTIDEPYRMQLSFDRWLLIGVPAALGLLPFTWFLLTRLLFPLDRQPIRGGGELIRQQLRTLGPFNRGERITLAVFVATALAWIARPVLAKIEWSWGGEPVVPFRGLSDAGIAMTAAVALFVLPVDARRRVFVLDWATAEKLPWGVLILFGGGLSLAGAVQDNGVAEYIGSVAHQFQSMPPVIVVLLATSVVVYLTELTSNTATAATFLPIMAALAPGLGVDPRLLVLPVALGASCAFMLPVATPPNAIIFVSGEVRMSSMVKAGFWVNLYAIGLIVGLTMLWYSRLIATP